jgi:hypothetical protein
VVRELADRFKAQPGEILERVAAQADELRATAKELVAARGALAVAKASALAEHAEAFGPHRLLVQRLDGVDGAGLQEAAQRLQQQLGEGAAVVLGGLSQLGGRWRTLRLVTVVAALCAVAWHVLVPATLLWPGVTMLVAAVALVLTSRATEGAGGVALETTASTLALATLLPGFTFPWPSPLVPQLIAGLVVAAASVLSVLRGRTFRTTWIAAVALTMALLCCVGLSPEGLLIAMTIALLATPALVPAVTVPVASLVLAVFFQLHLPASQLPFAYALHAVVLAAAGLLDRVPLVKRYALNGHTIGWPSCSGPPRRSTKRVLMPGKVESCAASSAPAGPLPTISTSTVSGNVACRPSAPGAAARISGSPGV